MKATKIISECELFRLFSLCGEAFSSDEISTRLETAIEHFVERISRLLRKRPVIDQLRLLAHLCGYLERMKYRYAEEPIKKGYFETIIAHVEIERRILLVQLRYPALATRQSKHIRSPYYWSAEYTLTDLMELISQGRRYACRIEQARPHFRTAAECFVQESRPLPQCRA